MRAASVGAAIPVSVPLLVTLFAANRDMVALVQCRGYRISHQGERAGESGLPRLSVVAAFSVVSPWLMISPVLVN